MQDFSNRLEDILERVGSGPPHTAHALPPLLNTDSPWCNVESRSRKIDGRKEEGLMRKLKYIASDPKIMGGKPCFKGTRIAVCTVLNFLAAGDSADSILKDYPQLTRSHIKEALGAAADIFDYKGMDIPA